jgi:hypothetical protein
MSGDQDTGRIFDDTEASESDKGLLSLEIDDDIIFCLQLVLIENWRACWFICSICFLVKGKICLGGSSGRGCCVLSGVTADVGGGGGGGGGSLGRGLPGLSIRCGRFGVSSPEPFLVYVPAAPGSLNT